MRPRDITDADRAYWQAENPRSVHTFTGPGEIEADVAPCPGLVTLGQDADPFGPAVRVAFVLDEIELARLARGGTLWLSTWGGLPMHMIEVAEP